MTHVIAVDNRKTSPTKGENLAIPVTIIECPPLKVMGIQLYKKAYAGKRLAGQALAEKHDKNLERAIPSPKKRGTKIENVKPEDYDEIRLLVHTQPSLTGIGKKKPEIFELGLGGSTTQQLEYAKNALGKEIKLTEVFTPGQHVDVHAVTKGKGLQGPVKRFGVAIRHHKSEKTRRGPGSLGPWHGTNYHRVAKAGQTGYHQRTEHNKWIMHISEDPNKAQAKGGLVRYGNLKNPVMLVKGSIPGPAKRLIKLTLPRRPNRHIPTTPFEITTVSTTSKQ